MTEPSALPFAKYVERISALMPVWALDHGRQLPTWHRVLVREELFDHATPTPVQWHEAAGFEPRFTEILAEVARDWLNISVDGVHNEVLRLAISYCGDRSAPDARVVSPLLVSVNLAGPVREWWAVQAPA